MPRIEPMFRRDPSPDATAISDRELGIASMLLLLAVVLTAVLVPAIA